MKAVVVKSFGGPEVMEYIDYKEPVPNKNQFLVNTRMIGVNYADTYQTENSYLIQTLPPVVPGIEASFMLNNKLFIGYASSGAYAEKILVEENKIFEVPDGVTEEEALSVMVQGSTAYGIVNYMCNIMPGDLVLINGVSGATGIILSQLCKLAGAIVIGVSSSQEKLNIVKELGLDYVCINDITEINKLIKSIGSRPKFIMESYGGRHFLDYYNLLSTNGHICSYGASSREGLPELQLREILKDSRTISGFWGNKVFLQNPSKLKPVVENLFELIKTKKIKIIIGEKMNLKNAKEMHEKIRSRSTYGKLILTNEI
jgi:NADPH2:quinone reductase